MRVRPGIFVIRLLPVLFVTSATVAFVAHVEGADAYRVRNSIPILLVALLAAVTLYKGSGRWTGAGWRWPLGTLGFAVPALGLSMYLHYGYAVDLDGMFNGAMYPQELFRFLPAYTVVAGIIGFAIGWIAGRNI